MHRWISLVGLVILVAAACSPDDLPFEYDDLPPGDAARGVTLFVQSIDGAPACSNCHATDAAKKTGPPLEGYSEQAGKRVGGQSAEEYTFYSIVQPVKHVVRGYSNVMYGDYVDKLSQQDIADLIAYMLSS